MIWIEDTEKMFYKKVPKEEKEVFLNKIKAERHVVFVIDLHAKPFCMYIQLDPKRLKKDMLKSLKLIKGEDRVLIVGTTKDPLSAEIKSLCKMYSKIILIPRPDYGSRYSKNANTYVMSLNFIVSVNNDI